MGDDDLVCVLVIPKSKAVVEYFWIKLVPSYYRMIFTFCMIIAVPAFIRYVGIGSRTRMHEAIESSVPSSSIKSPFIATAAPSILQGSDHLDELTE